MKLAASLLLVLPMISSAKANEEVCGNLAITAGYQYVLFDRHSYANSQVQYIIENSSEYYSNEFANDDCICVTGTSEIDGNCDSDWQYRIMTIDTVIEAAPQSCVRPTSAQ